MTRMASNVFDDCNEPCYDVITNIIRRLEGGNVECFAEALTILFSSISLLSLRVLRLFLYIILYQQSGHTVLKLYILKF